MKKFFRILAATMLLAVMATTLCSCGVPSDATKAKANLEKNGYTVFMVQGSYKGSIISINTGVEYTVTGTNGEESVSIIYYSAKESADKAYNEYKEKHDKLLKELKASYDDGKITKENYDKSKAELDNIKFGKSGKVFYSGTKAGVKAAC